ncbi:MAG: peptide chain release factor aRF-1 [Candidatus Odinarchaeota archaeon]
MSESISLQKFRLKKLIQDLKSKRGYHTELISLYIPPSKVLSDVTNQLNQEYGTASNIKSKTTRKNVLDCITKTTQRLKMIDRVPENGIVIFTGAIPQNGQGSEKIEQYVITPPKPINIYKYLCSSEFYLEPLEEQLAEEESYGLIAVDRSEASFAVLTGRTLQIMKTITSGAPSKHDAGGQSARRFERVIEQLAHEFNVRVGEYANKIFLEIKNLKGIVVGGPGPTKDKFVQGSYLDYRLKEKILAVIDIGYSDETGIKELVSRAEEVFKNVRFVEEKRLVQEFLSKLSKDTGLAIYGEREVKNALNEGSAAIILISESVDIYKISVKCIQCDYVEEKTVNGKDISKFRGEISNLACPKCNGPLNIVSEKNVIDEISELADLTSARVEIISTDTEEGAQLLNFGGIAAILRYKA